MKSNDRFAAGSHLNQPIQAPHIRQSSAHSASLHPRFPPRVPFGHAPPQRSSSPKETSTRRSLQESQPYNKIRTHHADPSPSNAFIGRPFPPMIRHPPSPTHPGFPSHHLIQQKPDPRSPSSPKNWTTTAFSEKSSFDTRN